LTNAQFIALLEANQAEWPPFQLGNWVYAKSRVGHEIVRTAVPT